VLENELEDVFQKRFVLGEDVGNSHQTTLNGATEQVQPVLVFEEIKSGSSCGLTSPKAQHLQ
jgi:hypothetical protein